MRAENLFCGKRPDYQMVSCGYFRRDCIKGIGVADYCPAQPPPLPEIYYVNGSERPCRTFPTPRSLSDGTCHP